MNGSSIGLLVGLCCLGFLGGFLARRAGSDASVAAGEGADRQEVAVGDAASRPGFAAAKGAGGAGASTIRSTDTVESLAEFGKEVPFERVALWLMDADESEISAYWEKYKTLEERNRDILDLIMVGWTRLNPQGAIGAVAGTGFEHFAWWAWSCHEPEAALAEAIANNPGKVGDVSWGIGEFHPAWLRENLDKIPEQHRYRAYGGLAKWGEIDDPKASLEFLVKNGSNPPAEMLGHLVKQDPWDAYEWVQEHGASLQSRYGWEDRPLDSFYRLLGHSHPEVLEQLVERTPAGANRRKMDEILFASLMEEDLEAAIEQAAATKATRVATERLGSVGLRLLRSDPERAFEVAEKMFTEHPDALNRSTRVRYPSGGSGAWGGYTMSGNPSGKPAEFVDALLAEDPGRVMQMFAEDSGGGDRDTWQRLGGMWASQDLEGFAHWVVDQDDRSTTNRYAPTIVSSLRGQQRFEEAAEWGLGVRDHHNYLLPDLLRAWERSDRERARQWLEAADLPEAEKQKLKKNASWEE